MNLAL